MPKSCGLILVFVEQLQPPLLLPLLFFIYLRLRRFGRSLQLVGPRELVREPANNEPAFEPLGLENVAPRVALIT